MQNPKKQYKVKIGFLLHKKFSIHILLSMILNLLASAVIIGFSAGVSQPILAIEPLGYVIGILLFTLTDNFIRILLYKYLLKYMIMSFGIISYILMVLQFFMVDSVLGPTFAFLGVEHLLIFILFFAILRWGLTYYYQRYMFIKKVTRR